MTQTLYLITFAVLGAAVGGTVSWAYRTGGPGRLWATVVGVAGVLLMLALWDWHRQARQETPLLSYILAALVPPTVVAVAVSSLAIRRVTARTQVLVGTVAYWAASIVAVIAGLAVKAN